MSGLLLPLIPAAALTLPGSRPRLTSRDLVKRAQDRLKQEGYYNGLADGAMNPATRAAVKRYQLDKGLRPDGRVNRETAQRLGLVLILGGPHTPEAR